MVEMESADGSSIAWQCSPRSPKPLVPALLLATAVCRAVSTKPKEPHASMKLASLDTIPDGSGSDLAMALARKPPPTAPSTWTRVYVTACCADCLPKRARTDETAGLNWAPEIPAPEYTRLMTTAPMARPCRLPAGVRSAAAVMMHVPIASV